jgi:hypothetical protein
MLLGLSLEDVDDFLSYYLTVVFKWCVEICISYSGLEINTQQL